ncbi:transcriptional regulator, TetR family [Streptoalloteichus tenebrarius]|uniref:Transcriptional regulator, TetR family n=1 Tax=Streptoalloteichus tenebrarius (strain ATCC 17920 / DSM 40477 / JCM 4838 / CBS 697.72 / NBRC 16177 / NCIMB 11028 / NRRL B-12390 / A12253. 1 / ISP 5477) TaxID=1933 RepID=A0ABT1HLM0_STRSD|nr:TetR/AcrR family transcriptional regulator [Streptoalloteichus tenebrarius]MCP2256389.1 transcriptional regulator, TetR family [Streptoalloteichus tenebrarius]BFF04734.1 TetR/AcrR family transcriptional regulator [Streptoalloteichus tenebrarius]
MPRTKPGKQRRSELLDAAESLVLRNGVDSFTVDDVTVGAGVAKGTFYLHFANKNELITALRERYVERFVARQREAARTAEDGVARVEQWMLAGIDEHLADIRLHDLLFHTMTRPETPTRNPSVDALHDLLREIGADLVDPEATAVVLYHAMHGIADHIVHFPQDRDRMLAEAARLCRALVVVPAPHLTK